MDTAEISQGDRMSAAISIAPYRPSFLAWMFVYRTAQCVAVIALTTWILAISVDLEPLPKRWHQGLFAYIALMIVMLIGIAHSLYIISPIGRRNGALYIKNGKLVYLGALFSRYNVSEIQNINTSINRTKVSFHGGRSLVVSSKAVGVSLEEISRKLEAMRGAART